MKEDILKEMHKEEIKQGFTVFRNLMLILAIGVLCGILSLTLVYILPVNEELDNVRESAEILETEGWYPTWPYMEEFTRFGIHTDEPGTLDNYTDEIMISTAANSVDGKWLYHAMDMKGYSRYWHGYVVILRPLLLLFNYAEIRKISMILQIFLILVLALLLYKRKGVMWSFWVATIYAMLSPAAMGMSLQFSWVFYIGIIGSIVLIRWTDFFSSNHRIFYLFFVLGGMTSFFDLLTYPLFTWGIPMIVWIAMDGQKGEKHRLKEIVICGMCWVLGYGGMWFGKWLLATLILHRNVISNAWSQVVYRSGLGSAETDTYGDTLLENIRKVIGVQGLLLSLGWSACMVFRLVKTRGKVATDKCLSFTLIAVSSFAWYFVLREHTYLHQWFTFRIYAVFFGALLAALISAVEAKAGDVNIVKPMMMKCVWTVIFIISFLISLQYKNEWWYHNGAYAAKQIDLEEGSRIEQSIIPRHDEICKLDLGLGAVGDSGEFLIEIYSSEDVLIYEKSVPVADTKQAVFYELPVDIKTGGNELRLSISAVNCDGSDAYVLVTQGEMPLEECTELTKDGEPLGGQMTQGITYWWYYGKKECLNFFLNSIGTLTLLFLDILCVISMAGKNTINWVKGKSL